MTTEARRRAIREAIEHARRLGIDRREHRVRALRELYGNAADQLADWLADNADADGHVGPEKLAALDAFLQGLLRFLQGEWQKLLDEGLAELAVLGAGATAVAEGSAGIAAQTLEQLRRFVGEDGLQLSDRIWRINSATRTRIEDTLRGAIARGATARDAARALLGEGKGVSAEIAAQASASRAGPLAASLRETLLTGTGNPLFNAERVMRTEMNRAFTESFVESAFQHPDVAAVKFNLSPAHPRVDVCDGYAHANLHGLGAGVYPKGNHPYPAHPQTLSYLTVVFVDEITAADRAGKQTLSDWLRAQPQDMQQQILGIAKSEAFRAGQLADADLLRPWKALDPRRNMTP